MTGCIDPRQTPHRAPYPLSLHHEERKTRPARTRTFEHLLVVAAKQLVSTKLLLEKMADVLALVASIASLADVTLKIVSGCRQYIDSIRDAPDMVRRLEKRMTWLNTYFEDLQQLPALVTLESKSLTEMLGPGGSVDLCVDAMLRLNGLIQKHHDMIEPATASQPKKMQKRLARLDTTWLKEAEGLLRQVDDYYEVIHKTITYVLLVCYYFGP